MKKLLFTLILTLLGTTSIIADDDNIELCTKGQLLQGGGRSLTSQVYASIVNNIISVDIYYYAGNATVNVIDATNNVVETESDNVLGSSSIFLNVSNLNTGTYTLQIALNDNTYEGTFSIN